MEETDLVACRNGELISDPNFNPGAKYNVQPLTPLGQSQTLRPYWAIESEQEEPNKFVF